LRGRPSAPLVVGQQVVGPFEGQLGDDERIRHGQIRPLAPSRRDRVSSVTHE